MWHRDYQLKNAWKKGTIIKQVLPVAHLIDNSQNIFQKFNDQLHAAYTSIEIDQERFCENSSAIKSVKYSPN